ncbi:MAG: hypothetical protein VXY92_11700, partial [Planctomycetota bacterium]|nr:hypothetical protein [Planctomycetota bacterium]
MSTHRHITAAALLSCALSHAQGPTSWAARSFPNGVDAHAVEGQGKLVTYDTGSELHVFSSATRAWRSYAKSPTTNVRLFNDLALLIDPDRVVAVSSYFAEPAKRTFSAPYSFWNSPAAKNDSVVLIREGSLLHAFSAFSGQWVTRAIDPSASGAVQRHVAVVASGNQLFGMSAFEGRWHDTDANAPSSLSSDGTAAFAFGPTIHAFSAHTRRWSHATTPPNASFARGDDWGIWLGPSGGLAYSGLTGSLAAITLPDAAVAVSSDLYALFGDSSELYAYSAVTGDVLSVGAAPTSVDAGLGAALLHAPNGVRGYSPMRQQTQPLAANPVSSSAGAACAHIVDAGGTVHAFSAFTGAWHTAPAGTAGHAPLATTTTLALTSPLDCYAFSPKTGHYEALG